MEQCQYFDTVAGVYSPEGCETVERTRTRTLTLTLTRTLTLTLTLTIILTRWS